MCSGSTAAGKSTTLGSGKSGTSPKSAIGALSSAVATGPRVYEMEVALLSGPISRAYALKRGSRGVSRTIEIRGAQTLEDLHEAIFAAFDRFDAHLWEFQIGGKGP